MPDTYTQLWNRVLLRCPAAGPMLARDWIKNGFREVADARRWSWTLKRGQFIVPDLYRAGTVSVTQHSSTVTGAATAWDQSLVGRQFRLSIDPIYSIVRVHSTTSLELDAPYGGRTQAAVGYSIYQCYFTPPPDFKEFLSVWDPNLNWQLLLHTHQRDLNIWDAQRSHYGESYVVASADYSQARIGIVEPALQVSGVGPGPIATGSYTGPVDAIFTIECTVGGDAGVAQFKWKKDDGIYTHGVVTSTEPQDLQDGVQVYWPAAIGMGVSTFAIASSQERMSAMHLGLPFRGPLVDPTVSGFSAGNRSAAAFMYGAVRVSGGYVPGDVWIILCRASQAPGIPRYELWPHRQSNHVYPFIYMADLPDLDEPNAVVPFRGGEILVEFALAQAARWPGPSIDKPNPYYSLPLARMHEERFNRMLMDMEKNDDEIYEQDLSYTYPSLSWPWASPLGDAAWVQSHAIGLLLGGVLCFHTVWRLLL